jgi:2-hydroxychromene-2-carboxylate isomerase
VFLAASVSGVAAATFYYDLGSPYAWLAAERVDEALPGEVDWQPVPLGGLFRATGRSSWARTEARAGGMAEVERRAAAYGLPALRWPEPWPGDMLAAMRAAVIAREAGSQREFALAAFRHAFAKGHDLSDPEAVLQAAAAAGLDAAAVRERLSDQAVKDTLRAATEAAAARGVFGVPTVVVGDEVFWGDDRLEDAGRAGAA